MGRQADARSASPGFTAPCVKYWCVADLEPGEGMASVGVVLRHVDDAHQAVQDLDALGQAGAVALRGSAPGA